MEAKPIPAISAASAPYWEAAANGKLLLQYCDDCSRYLFYPRSWCPHCYGGALEWRTASGRGAVHTYSVVHAAPCVGFEADAPYVAAVIDLQEGPRMMANIIGCATETVRVGMPVEGIFEARGNIHLPQFRPVTA
ncbi:MAG: nucleic acid-binding protein [Proteobacteria bacterium]|nr:MAG: nucleic acid-binding protein [Pseudomonadota bacterium]